MAENFNDGTIEITKDKIAQLLALHDASEKRLSRAMDRGSKNENAYRAECIAYERVLDVLGIDWVESI